MHRLALAASLLLAPALAAAQPLASYQFGNGTLLLAPGFTPDGCGTYVCLAVRAGPGTYPNTIALDAVVTRVRPAYAALGPALFFDYRIPVGVGSRACPVPPSTMRCETDGSEFMLSGTNVAPAHFFYGAGPTDGGTLNTYTVYVQPVVTFEVVGPDGVLATDTFAPAVVVTPEPATLALMVGGLAVLGAVVRRRGAF